MNIRKSAEDYLQQILILREEKGFARSVDIANGLGVSKPSVSFAMKKLYENGYIERDTDNFITLTDQGRELKDKAREIPLKVGSCIALSESEAQAMYGLLYKLIKGGEQ